MGGIPPQVWGSTTAMIASCSWLNHPYIEYSLALLFFFFFWSLTENFQTTFVRKTPKVTFFFLFFWSLTGFFFQKKLVRQVIKLEWPYAYVVKIYESFPHHFQNHPSIKTTSRQNFRHERVKEYHYSPATWKQSSQSHYLLDIKYLPTVVIFQSVHSSVVVT